MTSKYIPKPLVKYPVGDRLLTQRELYMTLLDPLMDRKVMAVTVEPYIVAIEEKSAAQCTVLQSALARQLR
jgi:hypothetical protein